METLKIKLKGVVEDSTPFDRLGDLKLHFSIPSAYAPANVLGLFRPTSGIEYSVQGASRVDAQGNPSATGTYLSAGEGTVKIYSKYDLTVFKVPLINWGNGKYIWIDDISELAQCFNLTEINIPSGGTTGNLESLTSLTKLKTLTLNKTSVEGDLLVLFRGLVTNGWNEEYINLPNIGQWYLTASGITFNDKALTTDNFAWATTDTVHLRVYNSMAQLYDVTKDTVLDEASLVI